MKARNNWPGALLGLAFVLITAVQARGQASDTFPVPPFNGLQITYSISGVTVDKVEDIPGFTTKRLLSGKATGSKAVLTVTVSMQGGLGGSVEVTASGGVKPMHVSEPVPRDKTVKLDPIEISSGDGPVSFDISLDGSYANAEYRSVVVSGSFEGKPKPKPTPPAEVKKETKKEVEVKITGVIKDASGRPMPHLLLSAKSSRTKETIFPVDEAGRYEVKVKIPDPAPDNAGSIKIKIILSYRKDRKEWFKLVRFPAPKAVPEAIVSILEIQADPARPEITKDISFQTESGLKTNIGDLDALQRSSVIYNNYHDALKFARDKLKADLAKYIPLTVQVGCPDDKFTVFDFPNNTIILEEKYTAIGDPTGLFCQHHEFGHFIHYAGRGGRWYWGASSSADDKENRSHGGYANDETADSIMEGTAHFFAALVARFKDAPAKQPSVLGTFGDLSQAYVPWDHLGRDEEFAFGALMWDVLDKVQLNCAETWKCLITRKLETITSIYEQLTGDFPKKKGAIDSVFRNHGMYTLKRVGNGVHDEDEAFFDQNSNGQWDPDERFIDYSVDKDGKNDMGIKETDTVVIGRPANYQRIDVDPEQKAWKERYSTFRFSNGYLKLAGGSADFLKIKIRYGGGEPPFEVTAPVEKGRIAIPLLPSSVKAEFLVLPANATSDSEALYRSSTEDIERKFLATRGTDSLDTVNLPPTMAATPPLSARISLPADDEDFTLPETKETVEPIDSKERIGGKGSGKGLGGTTGGGGGAVLPRLESEGGTAIIVIVLLCLAMLTAIVILLLRRRRTADSVPQIKVAATLRIVFPDGRRQEVMIRGTKTSIGRGPKNSLVVDDPTASSRHAVIVVEDRKFLIRDAGSSNGTFLNGAKVVESRLYRGDEIVVGSTRIVFDA